jgi:sirohydrochlorin ferrochelatase
MMQTAPTLLIAAHGTRSEAGAETVRRLASAVRAARPEVEVRLCFLDVLEPSLAQALPSVPTVVVPALLSTGFHVRKDIASIVAGRRNVRVGRHLGPHALLATALADRLAEARGEHRAGRSIALVATGSTDPGARAELHAAAAELARRTGATVFGVSLADDFAARVGPGVEVASYLLAEGAFADKARAEASAAGAQVISTPLGSHPAVIALIWQRYDAALDQD